MHNQAKHDSQFPNRWEWDWNLTDVFGSLRSQLTATTSQPSAAMSAQGGTGIELCSFFIFNSTFGPREGEVSQIHCRIDMFIGERISSSSVYACMYVCTRCVYSNLRISPNSNLRIFPFKAILLKSNALCRSSLPFS